MRRATAILLQHSNFGPKVRSEAENFSFFRFGLKPMLEDASRRELSQSVLRIEKGALCAELRQFYCSIRMLVPMSYMYFVDTKLTLKEKYVKT